MPIPLTIVSSSANVSGGLGSVQELHPVQATVLDTVHGVANIAGGVRAVTLAVYEALLLRGYGGLKFDFGAGSIQGVAHASGTTSAVNPTYTRATIGTVVDFEGSVKNVLSGEARFGGMRRVYNQCPTPSTTIAISGNKTITASVGTWVFSMGPEATGTCLITFTGTATGSTGTLTADPTRRTAKTLTITGAGTIIATCTVAAASDIQFENVTNQSNQNPSEYVSVGAPKLNELIYTEDFSQAIWVKTNATCTANATVAPDGTMTADKLEEDGTNGYHVFNQPTTSGSPAVYSVRMKAAERSWGYLQVGAGGAYYDLVNGVLGNVSVGWTAGMESLGNGWWLCWIYHPNPINTNRIIMPATGNLVASYIGTPGSGIYVWGAHSHINQGTTPLTYYPVGNVYPYPQQMVGNVSAPGVDGVGYSCMENPFTVTSNVVTDSGARVSLEGYAVGQLPGASGAYFSTPDSAANSVTGDIDIRVKATLDSWVVDSSLVGKMGGGAGTRGYRLYITSGAPAGRLVFQWSADGTSVNTLASSVTAGLTAGTMNHVRVTFDVDNGAGGADCKFYTSQDGEGWTQLGTTQTFGSTTSIYDATSVVEISSTSGVHTAGRIHRAQVYNGIGGTLVADFNPRDYSSGTTFASATTGETWTVNGAASIFKSTICGLQIEEARTNLVLQSSNFGTTWLTTNTPTRVAAAAYCGDIALDLIGDDSGALLEEYYQQVTFTGDAVKSVSFIVKQGSSTSTAVRLRDSVAAANRILGVITWSAGVPTYTPTTGTQERAPQALGNGCYRIFIASTSVTAANSNFLSFFPATDAALDVSLQGTLYVGGVQAENGITASSHVPTTTGTVPRNADVFTCTLGAWFNAAAGTGVADGLVARNEQSSAQAFFEFGDGGANNRVNVNYTNTGANLYMIDGGVAQVNASAGTQQLNTQARMVFAWSLNNSAGIITGGSLVTDTSCTVPAVTQLQIGGGRGSSEHLRGFIKSFTYYPVRLPDAVLQALST